MAVKKTISDMKKLAEERNGECLSVEYINMKEPLTWKCNDCQTVWENNFKNISRGSWCPSCTQPSPITIESLKQLAAERGGACLSDEYLGSHVNLLWECAEGHQWWAQPSNVKYSGTWCGKCQGNVTGTIEEARQFAETLGGKCLSDTYVNNRTPLLWECEKGHQFEKPFQGVKQGNLWCNICRNVLEKITIQEMKELANERRGKCLSDDMNNAHDKLLWECAEGHQWWATANSVKHSGTWCKTCKGLAKLTIEEAKQIAEQRNGKCLSDTYQNLITPLLWECEFDHRWEATLSSIKHSKSWCGTCSGRDRYNLEEAHKIARAFGGKCLSTEYKNVKTKLLWECEKGHQFEKEINSVIHNKRWCIQCREEQKEQIRSFIQKNIASNREGTKGQKKVVLKQRHGGAQTQKVSIQDPFIFYKKKLLTRRYLGLEDMHEVASERGGKCLSNEYINAQTKLEWECSKGHRWWAVPNSVVHAGSWCKTCKGLTKKNINQMRILAEERGGKCLSTEYKDGKTPLLWECADGHQWWATPNNVDNKKSWCPHCPKYTNEEKCRFILEQIFDRPFPKSRNIVKPFELDGYNRDLKLAFEFHGRQHYEFVPFFYRTKEDFEKRQKDDVEKIEACNKQGIKLIIIPHYVADSGDEELVDFIVDQATALGYSGLNKTIAFKGFYKHLSSLEGYRQIAESRGGRIVSDFYINSNTHLEWECAKGHIWMAKPHNIHRHWCPQCAEQKKMEKRHKEAADRFKKMAEEYGGKLLSTEITTIHESYEWECERGHRFSKVANVVKHSIERRGVFCTECAEVDRNHHRGQEKVEIIQRLAESKGGKWLFETTPDVDKPLLFECQYGHRFYLSAKKLKAGSWCKYKICNVDNIEEYEQLEKEREEQKKLQDWEQHVAELKQYQSMHGNCLVPKQYPVNPMLAKWVAKQRRDVRARKLSASQINQLNELGFAWNHDEEWENRLREYMDYRNKIKASITPSSIEKNETLSKWIQLQRRKFRTGSLVQEKIDQLDQYGFIWTPEEELWEDMFLQMQTYKQTFGHCEITTSYPENPSLAKWAIKQRSDYRKGVLSSVQIKRLNQIGFVWEIYQSKWQRMIRDLALFKEKYGHASVPYVYEENLELANFCIARRMEYKNRTISPEKVKELNEIGFVWEPYEIAWEEKYQEFLAYKETHRDCLVPRGYADNTLYAWVRNQRIAYKDQKISQERIERLERIGFIWDQYEYQWMQKYEQLIEYKQQHQTLTVTSTSSEYCSLRNWVNDQRKLFKSNKLNEERISLLQSIDFVF